MVSLKGISRLGCGVLTWSRCPLTDQCGYFLSTVKQHLTAMFSLSLLFKSKNATLPSKESFSFKLTSLFNDHIRERSFEKTEQFGSISSG